MCDAAASATSKGHPARWDWGTSPDATREATGRRPAHSRTGGERQLWAAVSGVGCRNAPMSQNTGKKIPKKNIHPCPFLSVTSPSVSNKTTYRMKPPIPITHHIGASFVSTDLYGAP